MQIVLFYVRGCGEHHSLCVDANGDVWCLGSNTKKAIGVSSTNIPTKHPTLCDIQKVAAGEYHSAALDSSGCLWMFGNNLYGQIGIGSKSINGIASPQTLSASINVIDVACGYNHALCLARDGKVYSFGCNESGQLGTGFGSYFSSPKPVTDLDEIVSVAAMGNFSLFLDANGISYASGMNDLGQLGQGNQKDSLVPLQIPNLPPVHSIAAGFRHALFLCEGEVYGTGSNIKGQLGLGAEVSNTLSPAKISCLPHIAKITTGLDYSFFVDIQGSLWATGDNTKGKLGVPTKKSFVSDPIQVKIPGMGNIVVTAKCHTHTIVKDNRNQIWVSGDNTNGQIGPWVHSNSHKSIYFTLLDPEFSHIIQTPFNHPAKSARK